MDLHTINFIIAYSPFSPFFILLIALLQDKLMTDWKLKLQITSHIHLKKTLNWKLRKHSPWVSVLLDSFFSLSYYYFYVDISDIFIGCIYSYTEVLGTQILTVLMLRGWIWSNGPLESVWRSVSSATGKQSASSKNISNRKSAQTKVMISKNKTIPCEFIRITF